uniref:Uncharacterized protein n=1 Tax=Triticum urartu TaxID=4572 RepID=A0A8R7Q041_TRIUA
MDKSWMDHARYNIKMNTLFHLYNIIEGLSIDESIIVGIQKRILKGSNNLYNLHLPILLEGARYYVLVKSV